MSLIKTKDEIKNMRAGGKRLAFVLREVAKAVAPGVSTRFLDELALRLIKEGGDTPAFLDYQPYGATYPFPAGLCVSINDEIVHGIPKDDRILKEGDIVGLDLGLIHKGLVVDAALTVPVGEIDEKSKKLIEVTKGALMAGIKVAKPGKRIGDIGAAISEHIKPHKYGVIKELGGHGVGHAVHEAPYVPNYGKKKTGELLEPGMTLAIEPMCNLGSAEIFFDADGYTVKTRDGARSAHFEHTILITEGEPEILTL